jgi:hypothetical protein
MENAGKSLLSFDTGRTCDSAYFGNVCVHSVKAIYDDGTWEPLGYKTLAEITDLFRAHSLEVPPHFLAVCIQ